MCVCVCVCYQQNFKTNYSKNSKLAVAQSVESSTADRRTQVQGSPGEKPSCMLMAPGACKISGGCNVLHVPIQNYTSWGTKAGEPSLPWRIKLGDGMSPDDPSG